MGDKTKIQWASASVNIWWGCDKVHAGCTSCYAQRMAGRFGVEWGATVPRRYMPGWRKTLAKVAARAKREGRKLRVFINDMSDLFDDHDGDVVDAPAIDKATGEYHPGRKLWIHPDTEWIGPSVEHLNPASVRPLRLADLRRQVFVEIDRYADCLIFVLVTKRPQNIQGMWEPGPSSVSGTSNLRGMTARRSNVWLLYSASDQHTLGAGLPHILKCGGLAPVCGLSLEPLLGEIVIPADAMHRGARLSRTSGLRTGNENWLTFDDGVLGWVIVGCEQVAGHHAGRFAVGYSDAAGDLLLQLRQAGVPAFHKQMPIDGLVSGEPSEWIDAFRVREYPQVQT